MPRREGVPLTAVILAAGVSSRLRPLTDAAPKSLLHVGGVPLLERNLRALEICGLENVVIVTGYLSAVLEEFVSSRRRSLEVAYVHNPSYASTNNNYSLWLALEHLRSGPILLLDADILYHPDILRALLSTDWPDGLVIRTSGALGDEEIKVRLNHAGCVAEIGKHVDPRRAAGESLGIEKFSAEATARLHGILTQRRTLNEFYEAAFQEMIDAGTCIRVVPTGGLPCMEIDTPEDLAQADEVARTIPL